MLLQKEHLKIKMFKNNKQKNLIQLKKLWLICGLVR